MKSHGAKWLVLQAACCLLWATRAGAQPEDRTHPLAVVPPIVVAPVVGVAPLGAKAGAKEVAAVGLSASAVKMPLLVTKLRAHQVTPQEAWAAGDLEVPDLIFFLESLDRWGGFSWDKDPDLRRQMVALLVEHGQKQLEHPEQLSPAVRLWLADYYQSLGDAKCLTLCESILNEQKEPQKGENALVFQTLERMAWFYRDQGQFEKSAQSWLCVSSSIPDQGWWQPDVFVEAAKMYEQAGEVEKAEQTYAKAPIVHIAWPDGVTVTNHAQLLIKLGRYKEARRLLSQGMSGPDTEGINPIILECLGDSYYFAGDLAQAASYARQAIASCNALQDSQHSVYLDAVLPINQERLRWIEKWPKEPIICAPRHLNVTRSYIQVQEESDAVTRRFYVRTLRRVPLRVSSNNKLVTARVVEGQSHQSLQRHFYQQEVSVSISPEAVQTGAQAIITINSPDLPAYQAQLPVLGIFSG